VRRRAAIATLVALAAFPAAARADFASCDYDPTTKTVTATFDAATAGQFYVDAGKIMADSAQCETATVTNTDTIVVNGSPPVGDDEEPREEVFVNVSAGAFAPGATDEPGASDEIEFHLDLGVTSIPDVKPALGIVGSNGPDSIVMGGDPVGGPKVNLNAYESDGIDADIDFAQPAVAVIDLRGQGGADILSTQGGYGTGTTTLRPNIAVVSGGAGDDDLFSDGLQDLRPGPGDDDLMGYAGPDTVVYATAASAVTVDMRLGTHGATAAGGDGDGGTDTYHGIAPHIYGTPFADTLVGTDGSDLYGAEGPDTVNGHGDGDRLRGGPGVDTITGGDGGDDLDGGPDTDTLHGGPGNDLLTGGDGDDHVFGDEGGDVLSEIGVDHPLGGGVFEFGEDGADDLHGGDGADEVRYATIYPGGYWNGRSGAVNADGDGDDDDGESGEGDNVMPDVENLYGGGGDDTLTGTAGANLLRGWLGDDTVRGGDGEDELVGDDGDDDLDARDGVHDVVDCGAGADVWLADAIDEIRDSCERPAPPVDAPPPGPPQAQAPPFTPVVVPPPPILPPPKVAALLRLPSSKRCASRRRFTVRVRHEIRGTVRKVTISLNGKKVKTVTGRRLGLPIDLRGLPKKKVKVKLRVELTDGRVATDTRTYRTCATKKRKGKFG
jgi:Ca2+-binding RTX toxin-like protein